MWILKSSVQLQFCGRPNIHEHVTMYPNIKFLRRKWMVLILIYDKEKTIGWALHWLQTSRVAVNTAIQGQIP